MSETKPLELIYPKVTVLKHELADEGRFIANKIITQAKDGPEVADLQASNMGKAKLVQEFACITSPCGAYEFECVTLKDTPVGPVRAVATSRALALRRMHRSYLHNLEQRKACASRQEALMMAGSAKFFNVNV